MYKHSYHNQRALSQSFSLQEDISRASVFCAYRFGRFIHLLQITSMQFKSSLNHLNDNCGLSCFLCSLRRAEPQCLFSFNRCLINGILFSSLSGRVASTRCPPFPSALRSHVCSVLSERDTLPLAVKALSEFNSQTDDQSPKSLESHGI